MIFMERKLPLQMPVTRLRVLRILLLLAIVIVGAVIIFHDFPGHDHLSFLHDFLGEDSLMHVFSMEQITVQHVPILSTPGVSFINFRPPWEKLKLVNSSLPASSLSTKKVSCSNPCIRTSPDQILNSGNLLQISSKRSLLC